MLLAGDIHTNPGPRQNYPCTVCHENVKTKDPSVSCDICEGWSHTENVNTERVIDTLANVNQKLNAAIKDRPKIGNVMRRIGVLNELVDLQYQDEITQDIDTTLELILSDEARLRKEAADLEQVKGMLHLLGSEHIRAVPSTEGQLHSLCKIHITQQDKTAELSDDLESTLANYNATIALLSKQFVLWDKIVTELEIAAQPKKRLD